MTNAANNNEVHTSRLQKKIQ